MANATYTVHGLTLTRKGEDYVARVRGYNFVFERYPAHWRLSRNSTHLSSRKTLKEIVRRAINVARAFDRAKERQLLADEQKKKDKRSKTAKKAWKTRKANQKKAKAKAVNDAKKKAGVKRKPNPPKKKKKVRTKLGRTDAPWA